MTVKRASIFDSEDLDLSGFKPKAQPAADAVPAEEVRAVAEASNFPSREAKKERAAPPIASAPTEPIKRAARRIKTGRTAQLNARATEATVAEFYRIADAQGWKAAETLERAVAALKRELEGH